MGAKLTALKTFDYQFSVPVCVARVAAFHRDTSVLAILSPPPTILQLHSMEPLGEGSVSRFTIWAGPIPLKWEATHYDVSETGFTDVMTEGPMKSWSHTHSFIEQGRNETLVTEHVEFEHAGGAWGLMTRAFFAPPALELLFAYRKFQTRRRCARSL